jgi:hypothetical protein
MFNRRKLVILVGIAVAIAISLTTGLFGMTL